MFRFTIEGGLGVSPQDSQRPEDGPGPTRAPAATPALYPMAIDPRADAVQFMTMTEADYAAASFLDARMLPPGTTGAWAPWADVLRAAAGLPVRCHFIFHISHVGSTLLSRLLGQHPSVFSLREPAVLRTLADAHLALGQPTAPWGRAEFAERLGVFLALWSRTFRRGQTALIKATSFVSEMAEHLLERVADARAIVMYVPPPTFLRALLGGAMSDITGQAGKRLARLHRRLGTPHWRLQDLSAGESVAMSWLSEMFALHAAGARFPDRVLWIDFDRFLGAPGAGLAAALGHLGVAGADAAAERILSGPTMSQYAKAPAYRFDAQVRERLLRQGEEQHASEVRLGMDWLDRAAVALPPVRAVLEAATAPPRPAP
jgi:hypothetical protein